MYVWICEEPECIFFHVPYLKHDLFHPPYDILQSGEREQQLPVFCHTLLDTVLLPASQDTCPCFEKDRNERAAVFIFYVFHAGRDKRFHGVLVMEIHGVPHRDRPVESL